MNLGMKQVSNQQENYDEEWESPYRVLGDSNIVVGYLLRRRPATDVLEHLL
jgi:hypothetical protein